MTSDQGSGEDFVVPEKWIQDDINQSHEAYLERHGGQDGPSKQHAIPRKRIEQWRDCWEQLGIV
jgi:hypothetical protein